MNTIIVNGKKIKFSGNAVIKVRKDVVSDVDKKTDIDKPTRMVLEFEGDLENLICGDANIFINGNVNKVITNGNVKCNDINGKVVCIGLESNSIKGYISSSGDIITESFIGNTNIGKERMISDFVPITKEDLIPGSLVYHKKYGRGIIKDFWNTAYKGSRGSISIKFDSEEFNKTLFVESILTNRSLSLLEKSDGSYQEEYERERYYERNCICGY